MTVLWFEPGLTPVLKHGSHDQSTHGRRGGRTVSAADADRISRSRLGRGTSAIAVDEKRLKDAAEAAGRPFSTEGKYWIDDMLKERGLKHLSTPTAMTKLKESDPEAVALYDLQDRASDMGYAARRIAEQGFTEPSPVVSRDDFIALAQSGDYEVIFRGGPAGLADGMTSGQPWIGTGIGGPGSYFAPVPWPAVMYAQRSAREGGEPEVVVALLPKAAKRGRERFGPDAGVGHGVDTGADYILSRDINTSQMSRLVYNTGSLILVDGPRALTDAVDVARAVGIDVGSAEKMLKAAEEQDADLWRVTRSGDLVHVWPADVAKHGSPSRPGYAALHPSSKGGKDMPPAAARLAAGKPIIVAPKDVASVVGAFEGADGPVDLTNLHVAGHGLFGGDGLGIAREDMPQIPKTHRDKFFDEQRARGVSVTVERVDPLSMKPTQREMDAVNVAGMVKGMRDGSFVEGSHTLIASSDGYILDGHHRWAAASVRRLETGSGDMGIARVNLPIRQLLEQAQAFNEREGIASRALGDHRRAVAKAACDRAEARAVLKHLQGKHDQRDHGRKGGGSKPPLDKPIGMRDSDHPDEEITVIPAANNPLDGLNVVSIYKGGEQAGVLRYDSTGRVDWINVQPEFQRQGVATRLWESAKYVADRHSNMPQPQHSDTQTDDGKAWAAVVKFAPGLVPVLKHGSHNQKDHGRRFSGTVDPAVAAKAIRLVGENGGLSIKMTDGSEPDSGFMVARDSSKFGIAVTADTFYGPDGAKAIADIVKKNRVALGSGRAYLGIWHQKETTHSDGSTTPLARRDQVVHLDVTDNIPVRDRALRLGRRRNQISVWDVVEFEELPTGGTGAEVAKGTDRGRDAEAPVRDVGRGDRRLGGEGPRATGRAGLSRPVLKHGDPSRPGYAALHPDSKAGGTDVLDHPALRMPEGWQKRTKEEQVAGHVTEITEGWGAGLDPALVRTGAEALAADVDVYEGPNGSTISVATRDNVPEAAVIPQMRVLSDLQRVAPIPGLPVVVSTGPFEAHSIPDSTKGFVITGEDRIYLRPNALTTGVNTRSGHLMPVYGTDPHLYPLVHEYGHVLDRRDARTASTDKADVITKHQTGMSRYAYEMEQDGAIGREAFAEAWTGWFGSSGRMAQSPGMVQFFAEKYGWDAGGGGSAPSATFAKAATRLIIADTFTEEGALLIEIPSVAVVKFAPGLKPVLKHGDPSRPGYAALHPNGSHGTGGTGRFAAWGDRHREIEFADRHGPSRSDIIEASESGYEPDLDEMREYAESVYDYEISQRVDQAMKDGATDFWYEHGRDRETPEEFDELEEIRNEHRERVVDEILNDYHYDIVASMESDGYSNTSPFDEDGSLFRGMGEVYNLTHSGTGRNGDDLTLQSRVSHIERLGASDSESGYPGVRVFGDVMEIDPTTGRAAPVGEFEREITFDGDEIRVNHSLLNIWDETHQGTGFGSKFIRQAENWYIARGVKKVEVHAALSVGGYAWATMGFDFTNSGTVAYQVSRYSALPDARLLPKKVRDDLDNITLRFGLRRDDPDYPTPMEVASVGRVPGARVWPGNTIMAGSHWYGAKPLIPEGGRVSHTEQDAAWRADMEGYARELTQAQAAGQMRLPDPTTPPVYEQPTPFDKRLTPVGYTGGERRSP